MLNSMLCIFAGYLFGCISTGYLVAKWNHVDIRNEGSGNVGSTNALRTMGVKGGALTLAGDISKALIPVLLVKYYFFRGLEGMPSGLYSTEFYTLLTGLGVILGHNFPFWMKFKGGKGIASTGGVLLAFNLPVAGVLLAVFLAVVAVTRYVSLGSLLGIAGLPVAILICYPGKWVLFVLGLLYVILAFFRHRANIGRLIHGTENKLGAKNKETD